jgi:hypothetical protein
VVFTPQKTLHDGYRQTPADREAVLMEARLMKTRLKRTGL